MAAGDYRIGLDSQMKWGAAGSTPTTITYNVTEVSLALNPQAQTVIPRGTNYTGTKVTHFDPELTFTMWDKESDGFRAAVIAAARAKTAIALYPKDASGGDGLDCDWIITSLGEDQPNDNFVTNAVTAKPALERSREPAYR